MKEHGASTERPTLHQRSPQLAAAVDLLNCGVSLRDAEGKILYLNERLSSWLGYEQGELVGTPISGIVPPETRDLMLEEMAAVEAGDLRARLTVLQRKDSSTFPAITLPQRLLDEEGRLEGTIVVVVDLGAVQTAKPAGYGGPNPVCAALARIALELQSIALSVELPGAAPVPLDHPDLASLSPREREVLAHLMSGSRVPAIATSLHISQHTVRNHLKSIYRKSGVSSQSALIGWVQSLARDPAFP